ncbi:MAG: hypothetical protein LBR41_02820, partial [Rickettsiales bacterium]|nr:hypothetical protein [Rickettsiales bacterium]
MSTDVEYLDKCTLLQACEWIAFGYKPRLAIYEAAATPPRPSPYESNQLKIEKYLKDMNDAKNKLKLALFQKTIIAKGRANKNLGWS